MPSDLELVVEASKKLERLLDEQWGASGRGLHEKTSSVEHKLDHRTVRDLRFVASVRNGLIHDEGKTAISERRRFELAVERLAEVLTLKPSQLSSEHNTPSTVPPQPKWCGERVQQSLEHPRPSAIAPLPMRPQLPLDPLPLERGSFSEHRSPPERHFRYRGQLAKLAEWLEKSSESFQAFSVLLTAFLTIVVFGWSSAAGLPFFAGLAAAGATLFVGLRFGRYVTCLVFWALIVIGILMILQRMYSG